MKTYLYSVAYISYVVATFGFILPFTVSAASTILLFVSYFLLALFPVISYKFVMMIKNKWKAKSENS